MENKATFRVASHTVEISPEIAPGHNSDEFRLKNYAVVFDDGTTFHYNFAERFDTDELKWTVYDFDANREPKFHDCTVQMGFDTHNANLKTICDEIVNFDNKAMLDGMDKLSVQLINAESSLTSSLKLEPVIQNGYGEYYNILAYCGDLLRESVRDSREQYKDLGDDMIFYNVSGEMKPIVEVVNKVKAGEELKADDYVKLNEIGKLYGANILYYNDIPFDVFIEGLKEKEAKVNTVSEKSVEKMNKLKGLLAETEKTKAKIEDMIAKETKNLSNGKGSPDGRE